MGRNLQPAVSAGIATSTVLRSSYLVMILVTMYSHYKNLIDQQAMRTQLGKLIRDYTCHKTWRMEATGHSKFAVTFGTPSALNLIKNGHTKELEVEHAIPIDTIIDIILENYKTAEEVNPFLSTKELDDKTLRLEIDIADRTLLVYVTHSEHRKLPNRMPKDHQKTLFGDLRLARYAEANIDLEKVGNLFEHPRIYGADEKYGAPFTSI